MISRAWEDRVPGVSDSRARAIARRMSGGRLVEVSTTRERRLSSSFSTLAMIAPTDEAGRAAVGDGKGG
jgi:hypothetical protein